MTVKLPDAAPDRGGLFEMLLELASQLHAERSRRIALECVLEEKGLLDGDWSTACEDHAAFRERSAAALDRSMDGLFRVMQESDDPRQPLRHEAAAFDRSVIANEEEK